MLKTIPSYTLEIKWANVPSKRCTYKRTPHGTGKEVMLPSCQEECRPLHIPKIAESTMVIDVWHQNSFKRIILPGVCGKFATLERRGVHKVTPRRAHRRKNTNTHSKEAGGRTYKIVISLKSSERPNNWNKNKTNNRIAVMPWTEQQS